MAEPALIERLLTVQEVAAILKVHPKTVARAGIPAVTVGTGKRRPRKRYRLGDVQAWLDARTN